MGWRNRHTDFAIGLLVGSLIGLLVGIVGTAIALAP